MANLYDLKKFDLNLLVIFECIFQHLSISKAAETLYITPSAVSQSLQRLRTQLNDPLFIRSGKGITPTTVGNNLHYHLEQNLNQIEQTINIMHGSSLKKNFVIYCPQLLSPGNLLKPIKLLIDEQNYEIEQRDLLLSTESAEDLLAYRKADIVFTLFPVSNRSIVCTQFSDIPVYLVCREGHPRLNQHAAPEELSHEKFTLYISQENGVKEFQSWSAATIPERNIVFRSDSIISIINILSTSDLVGFLPSSIFETYKDTFKLKHITLPIPLPQVELFMLYNRASLNSSAFSQLISQLAIS